MEECMLIYEVNLTIAADIYAAFTAWLGPHIRTILQFPGFQDAKVFAVETQDSTQHKLCVHYQVTEYAFLQTYLTQQAATMRQDAIDHFGDKFRADRRILLLDKKIL
jgi:hypothetical protein